MNVKLRSFSLLLSLFVQIFLRISHPNKTPQKAILLLVLNANSVEKPKAKNKSFFKYLIFEM